jgi:hypothetical protein
MGLARQLEEAVLSESFVISGSPGGPYFLQQTVLGDVTLAKEQSDTWKVVRRGEELARACGSRSGPSGRMYRRRSTTSPRRLRRRPTSTSSRAPM